MSWSRLAQPSSRQPIPKAMASHKSDGLRSISGVSQPSTREPSGLPPKPWRVADSWWSLAFAGTLMPSGRIEAPYGGLGGRFHAARFPRAA
jgi:hypothetical protein